MGIQYQLRPTRGMRRYGTAAHLETQPERQIPTQLQAARQQTLDDIQLPATSAARPCTATTAAPAILPTAIVKFLCQYPLFRCHPCRRMASGMTRSGAEVLHHRFAKKRDIAISLAAPGLSCARAGRWAGCVKSAIGKWRRRMPLAAPALPNGRLELDGLWTRTRNERTRIRING